MLGTEIADFSRSYFFSLALGAYALMVSYNYTGWPFDNACRKCAMWNAIETAAPFLILSQRYRPSTESDAAVPDQYVGSYTAIDGNGIEVAVNIEADDTEYHFCLQDMLRFRNPPAFPALARFQQEGEEWMTSDQERISAMLGWTSIAVLFFVAVIFINRILIRFLRNVLTSPYKVRGLANIDPIVVSISHT
jgi:hypothetical protein